MEMGFLRKEMVVNVPLARRSPNANRCLAERYALSTWLGQHMELGLEFGTWMGFAGYRYQTPSASAYLFQLDSD
jgi:hypothetical protein